MIFKGSFSKIIVKIRILSLVQIIFIIIIFSILTSIQSQQTLLGNTINIAGKNRFLTLNVLYEVLEYINMKSLTNNGNSSISLIKSAELQKDFIRIAAHELRNPIQPILVISEMLNSTVNSKKLVNSSQIRVDKQEINDYIDAIIRNTRKLVSLTNSILDITRIETNSLTLRKETVDLRLFLLEQVMEYENQYISKIENMDLHTTTSRDRCKTRMDYSQLNNSRIHCSLLVDLDKSMISQVVYNLLDNALSLQMRAT